MYKIPMPRGTVTATRLSRYQVRVLVSTSSTRYSTYLVQATESLVKHPRPADLGEVGLHEGLRLDEGLSKWEER